MSQEEKVYAMMEMVIKKFYPKNAKEYINAPYVISMPEFLGSDEELEAVLFGKIHDIPWPSSGGLWATDKRLLYLSKHILGKGVVDFTYDKIQSISLVPSWPHSVIIRTGSLRTFMLQYVDNEVASKFVNQVRSIMENKATPKYEQNNISRGENNLVQQLEKLSQLRERGMIDESEFASAKKKLLE